MSYKVTLAGVLLSLVWCVCSCDSLPKAACGLDGQAEKIKVVVITGGHPFSHRAFFAMFDAYDDIEYVEALQKNHSEIFEDITGWDYDVMVLYNMSRQISPKRQKNFIKLLKRGVGVVALHHSLASFQNWPEYEKIIGGKFHLQDAVKGGTTYKKSGYKLGVNFTISAEDKKHPITRALSDFAIYDETYKNCTFQPDNHVLLTTSEPSSDKPLCWVRSYENAKVCYIMSGHGPGIYADENYRRLVAQSIRWCAGKPAKK